MDTEYRDSYQVEHQLTTVRRRSSSANNLGRYLPDNPEHRIAIEEQGDDPNIPPPTEQLGADPIIPPTDQRADPITPPTDQRADPIIPPTDQRADHNIPTSAKLKLKMLKFFFCLLDCYNDCVKWLGEFGGVLKLVADFVNWLVECAHERGLIILYYRRFIKWVLYLALISFQILIVQGLRSPKLSGVEGLVALMSLQLCVLTYIDDRFELWPYKRVGVYAHLLILALGIFCFFSAQYMLYRSIV